MPKQLSYLSLELNMIYTIPHMSQKHVLCQCFTQGLFTNIFKLIWAVHYKQYCDTERKSRKIIIYNSTRGKNGTNHANMFYMQEGK